MSSGTQTIQLRDRDPGKVRSHAGKHSSLQNLPSLTQLEAISISAPLGILTRLSGSQLDPFTVIVSRHLFGIFEISYKGSLLVSEALANLHAFPSFQGLIWFGFGIKHPIHILAETANGTACVAMCACIGEAYSDRRAAVILDQMTSLLWDKEDVYRHLRPSLSQWKQLVQCCQGALATSSFSLLMEDLMKLCDSSEEPRVSHIRDDPSQKLSPNLREAGGVRSTAKALIALAEVSTGELESITITGQADCGFVAALAVWLFDLSVVVKLTEVSEAIYQHNVSERQRIHITWIINPSTDPGDTSVLRRTYAIPQFNDILLVDQSGHNHLAGRVPWQSVITRVFGGAGRRLLDLPSSLGSVLGAAARIFTAAATCSGEVAPNTAKFYGFPGDASHGIGFVDTATERFSELAPLRTRMEAALEQSFTKATEEYEQAMTQIAASCSCTVCNLDALDNSDIEFYGDGGVEPFCLPLLVSVIIRLIQCISCLVIRPEHLDMQPSRTGIEMFYLSYRELGRFVDKGTTVERLFNYCSRGSVLTEASWIYGGKAGLDVDIHTSGPNSALSQRGYCFYLEVLNGLSDDLNLVQSVCVVPGHVIYGLRTYELMQDYTTREPNYPARAVSKNLPRSDSLSMIAPDLNVSSMVSESFDKRADVLKVPSTLIAPVNYTMETRLKAISRVKGITMENRDSMSVMPGVHH
ncbi:MAG: hypothetical protein M1820_004907 [Bogoriella megaspora]|nr:MAG: hypothetical protein M1820_004907 [Bogoriella megaspora]